MQFVGWPAGRRVRGRVSCRDDGSNVQSLALGVLGVRTVCHRQADRWRFFSNSNESKLTAPPDSSGGAHIGANAAALQVEDKSTAMHQRQFTRMPCGVPLQEINTTVCIDQPLPCRVQRSCQQVPCACCGGALAGCDGFGRLLLLQLLPPAARQRLLRRRFGRSWVAVCDVGALGQFRQHWKMHVSFMRFARSTHGEIGTSQCRRCTRKLNQLLQPAYASLGQVDCLLPLPCTQNVTGFFPDCYKTAYSDGCNGSR